jgi:hypothetical protein
LIIICKANDLITTRNNLLMSSSEKKQTRAQTAELAKQTQYTFTHEFFLDSIKEWAKNKKKLDNGTYKYSCPHVYEKSGKICGKTAEHEHK